MWAKDSERFKLKSPAPEESWQGDVELYCIAHRLGLAILARISILVMTGRIGSTLRSCNVQEFIRRLYGLERPEIQEVKDKVAEKIAEHGPCVILGAELSSVITSHPVFGCDLVKAMA
jgi:hypothetical protein